MLEWNRHGDFARMGRYCTGGRADGTEEYRILDVDYIPQAGAAELARCLNGGYRRIIVDYGEITGESMAECARCDRKVIVGALSEWQIQQFQEEAGRRENRDQSWSYAAAFGSEETRKIWEKAFRTPCLRIPSSVDAFAVTRADMDFFVKLTGNGLI